MNINPAVIDAIINLIRDFPSISKAVLFGSRARGDNTERSDYDIAIYGDPNEHERAILRYKCDYELPTLHKIDLVFISDKLPAALMENIQKDGIPIYENR